MTSPAGKSYIGITTGTLINRMQRHRVSANTGSPYAIHCAIRKYGFKAFVIEVLNEEVDLNKLNALEGEAIVEHKTLYPNGYNLTTGGDGVRGPHTALRTKLRWRNMSEEERAFQIEKQSRASRAFWSNVTCDERNVMRERGANAARNWWANATSEQRVARAEKFRETMLSKSDEEKRRLAKLSAGFASSHWASLTEEERAAHAIVRSKAAKTVWANLTEEERLERSVKMKAGRAAAKAKREQNAVTNATS
jgi:hypothetical protein